MIYIFKGSLLFLCRNRLHMALSGDRGAFRRQLQGCMKEIDDPRSDSRVFTEKTVSRRVSPSRVSL